MQGCREERCKKNEYIHTSHLTPREAGILFNLTMGVLPMLASTVGHILGLGFLRGEVSGEGRGREQGEEYVHSVATSGDLSNHC